MKRTILALFFTLSFFSLRATHIVGGEFEMIYRGTNPITGDHLYNISLILYFDAKHGAEGAKDKYLDIRIFSKRTDQIMVNKIRLRLFTTTDVEYLQPECSSDESIETERMYYTYVSNGQPALYPLAPDKFNDSQGYYMSWERCCRNYDIANIYSEDPDLNVNNKYAGQTFYLEFPPLKTVEGKPFINSSPRLFPPLSDYACVGSLYYVDFAGSDPDGDSLVYSLTTPLNTHSGNVLPLPDSLPKPGPYVDVLWKKTYGIKKNIMDGSPDLKISTDGLLTVVPQKKGLFVFSVKCEEFREGVKIGEVRRDFQMLVKTCDPPHKPVIQVKGSTPGAEYSEDDLHLEYETTSATDAGHCVKIRVSDLKAPPGNKLSIRAIPIGFKNKELNDQIDISPPVSTPGGYTEFSVCFPACPFAIDPYTIGIIAGNNACPLPTLDTVYVTFDVTLPSNKKPTFDKFISDKIITNGTFSSLDVVGIDADNDSMTLLIEPYGFDLADYGFQFVNKIDQAGLIKYELSADTHCGAIGAKTDFEFNFTLNDKDLCNLFPPEKKTLNLHLVEPPENTQPHLEITNRNNGSAPVIDSVSFNIGQEINLDLKAIDPDIPLDNLKISLIKFDSANTQLDYEFTSNNGARAANFLWQPDCSIYKNRKFVNDYTFYFSVTDERCYKPKGDTIRIVIFIRDIDNESVNFIPPNFITPNDDGFNDYFAMIRQEPITKELINILPKDNCAGHFVNIRIYNRWGREVFLSTNRDFKWYAKDAGVGVYFYTLFFSDKEYKGTITVRE